MTWRIPQPDLVIAFHCARNSSVGMKMFALGMQIGIYCQWPCAPHIADVKNLLFIGGKLQSKIGESICLRMDFTACVRSLQPNVYH